jgi:hypothetical protein
MLKRFAQLAGLTLLLGMVFAPAAHASTRISVQIGTPFPIAPVVIAPGPPPGYIWQPGYRVWTGFSYRWVPGGWVLAPYVRRGWAGERWERERWERERRNVYRDRDWNRDRDRRDRDREERGYWRR